MDKLQKFPVTNSEAVIVDDSGKKLSEALTALIANIASAVKQTELDSLKTELTQLIETKAELDDLLENEFVTSAALNEISERVDNIVENSVKITDSLLLNETDVAPSVHAVNEALATPDPDKSYNRKNNEWVEVENINIDDSETDLNSDSTDENVPSSKNVYESLEGYEETYSYIPNVKIGENNYITEDKLNATGIDDETLHCCLIHKYLDVSDIKVTYKNSELTLFKEDLTNAVNEDTGISVKELCKLEINDSLPSNVYSYYLESDTVGLQIVAINYPNYTAIAPVIALDTTDYVIKVGNDSLYGIFNKENVIVTKIGKVEEAPKDGTEYVRKDGKWVAPITKNVTIDDTISDTSENPVQNKVIKTELDKKANNPIKFLYTVRSDKGKWTGTYFDSYTFIDHFPVVNGNLWLPKQSYMILTFDDSFDIKYFAMAYNQRSDNKIYIFASLYHPLGTDILTNEEYCGDFDKLYESNGNYCYELFYNEELHELLILNFNDTIPSETDATEVFAMFSENEITVSDDKLVINSDYIISLTNYVEAPNTSNGYLEDASSNGAFYTRGKGDWQQLDTELSDTSKNAVENKIIKAALDNKVSIPKTPLFTVKTEVGDWTGSSLSSYTFDTKMFEHSSTCGIGEQGHYIILKFNASFKPNFLGVVSYYISGNSYSMMFSCSDFHMNTDTNNNWNANHKVYYCLSGLRCYYCEDTNELLILNVNGSVPPSGVGYKIYFAIDDTSASINSTGIVADCVICLDDFTEPPMIVGGYTEDVLEDDVAYVRKNKSWVSQGDAADSELSETSKNPVQNKVLTSELSKKADIYTEPYFTVKTERGDWTGEILDNYTFDTEFPKRTTETTTNWLEYKHYVILKLNSRFDINYIQFGYKEVTTEKKYLLSTNYVNVKNASTNTKTVNVNYEGIWESTGSTLQSYYCEQTHEILLINQSPNSLTYDSIPGKLYIIFSNTQPSASSDQLTLYGDCVICLDDYTESPLMYINYIKEALDKDKYYVRHNNDWTEADYENLKNKPTIPAVVDSVTGTSTTAAPSVNAVRLGLSNKANASGNINVSNAIENLQTIGIPYTAQETTISNNDIEYVDLGLPSGTLWAKTNVGTDSVAETGTEFYWDETEYNSGKAKYVTYQDDMEYHPASGYDSENYCYTGDLGINLEKRMALHFTPARDAARVNMGGNWQVPCFNQMMELANNCDITTYTTTNAAGKTVTIYRYTSKINGNYIDALDIFSSSYYSPDPDLQNGGYEYFWNVIRNGESVWDNRIDYRAYFRGCLLPVTSEVTKYKKFVSEDSSLTMKATLEDGTILTFNIFGNEQ